jgi:sulfotransferase family protein
MTKLVYIGGYGRSGSTLLEYLLTASAKVVACGEVATMVRRGPNRKRKCTCGRKTTECPVWQFFNPRAHASQGSWCHPDLSLALLERFSDQYSLMIDSSKTSWDAAGAPFALRQRLGQDFLFVHIVRDPRAVCWSAIRRSERRASGPTNHFLRSAWTMLGWWAANVTCETFRWRYPKQYLRVRYEDLARSPRETLQRLLERALSRPEVDFGEPGSSDNRHQLYGNRMRHQQLSLADVTGDERWKVEMPRADQRIASCLSWALRWRYDY